MEAKSSRKFTLTVIFLSVLILAVFMVLTYVVLTRALNKPVTNNDIINNQVETTNSDVVEEEPEDQEVEDELAVEVSVYYFNQNKFDAAESDIFSETKRLTTREDIATYTLEQIIEGPTEEDFNTNLGIVRSFDEPSIEDEQFLATMEGESSCDGKDFAITSLEGKIATIKFCKKVITTGDFSSGIIFEQFRKTLTQFPTIEKVRVLRNDNTCFNDSVEQTFEECVR